MQVKDYVDKVNELKKQIEGCDGLINFYQDKKRELSKCLYEFLKSEVIESKTLSERKCFNPNIWDEELQKMLKKSIFWQCTNKKYKGTIKNQGGYVILPNAGKLYLDAKKFFAFKVDDAIKLQEDKTGLLQAHLSNSKKAIEDCIDKYLLRLHYCIENVIGSTDSPVKLDKFNIYEEFSKIAIRLNDNFIPKDGFWIIVNPCIKSIVVNSPEFIEASEIADTSIRENAIGRIAGMDVLVSENLDEIDGKYNVIAGANDAITFAGILAKIENLNDRDSFNDLIRGLYFYGLKIVEQKAILKVIVKAE